MFVQVLVEKGEMKGNVKTCLIYLSCKRLFCPYN